jgi:hypothetical protein
MNGVPMLYRTTRGGARPVTLQGALDALLVVVLAVLVTQLLLDLHRLGTMRGVLP